MANTIVEIAFNYETYEILHQFTLLIAVTVWIKDEPTVLTYEVGLRVDITK